MSPREQAQNQLVDWLETTSGKWTAPYGILPGLESIGNGGAGKVRTITFGVARFLDAGITIWSPNRITIQGRGAMASRINGTYHSVEEVIKVLTEA